MNKKILIIEDEQQIISVLSRVMKKAGFEVIAAEDGKEGLGKALKYNPDLILLDIVLPVMDGITFLEKYHKTVGEDKVPVIVLSNLDSADKIEESIKKGASDYLVKTNWTLKDIVDKVNTILKES